jgi:fumarylacetoacetase
MFRPDMPPLLPNYRHLPVAYNGRASTVVSSGTAITRPNGITKPAGEEPPIFGPTQELDFELELGFYVGRSTSLGEVVPISEAESSIAGVVLVNDWSSRDVQRFEYQPLGPFLAKSFATSISPWLVTLDALEPFRIQGPAQEPAVLPHLTIDGPQHYDLKLEVALVVNGVEHVVCRTTSAELYWSFAQQFAHQSSNGTALESGDLYATGTISGTEPGTFGSLLELTVRGSQPIAVGDQTRTFLQDGDEVVLRGYGSKDGHFISLGEVRGVVVPS